jgi:hypothetical protein
MKTFQQDEKTLHVLGTIEPYSLNEYINGNISMGKNEIKSLEEYEIAIIANISTPFEI